MSINDQGIYVNHSQEIKLYLRASYILQSPIRHFKDINQYQKNIASLIQYSNGYQNYTGITTRIYNQKFDKWIDADDESKVKERLEHF